jgi:MoxR-like ATPase
MNVFNSVTLKQCADLICAVGDKVTVLAQGEMGIGKSSMLKTLKAKFPDHFACYVDMTTKDVGDFAVPKIRTIDGVEVCSFIPNEEFGFHFDKPVIMMLDEVGKSSKAVFNASLRIILERKLGNYTLPEGSIVFATTNLAQEGIGDMIPPHARNRMTTVKISKPTADDWIDNYNFLLSSEKSFKKFKPIDKDDLKIYLLHKVFICKVVRNEVFSKNQNILKAVNHIKAVQEGNTVVGKAKKYLDERLNPYTLSDTDFTAINKRINEAKGEA